MSDRQVKLSAGWAEETPALRKLRAKGYSVGGYMDKGQPKYSLYRMADDDHAFKYDMVHEFNSAEELNNMVKLLLED